MELTYPFFRSRDPGTRSEGGKCVEKAVRSMYAIRFLGSQGLRGCLKDSAGLTP